MKRTFAILFLLVAAALFALQGVAAQASLDTTTTDNALLRSGPGTEWRRITVVAVGTPFRADGRAPGDAWLRGILPDGQIGWITVDLLNVNQEQVLSLPQIWVDAPFTLPPPGGVVPVAVDPVPAPTVPAVVAPVVNPAPAVNSAPLPSGFSFGGHVADWSQYASDLMRQSGMTWVKRQWRYIAGQNPADVAGWINDAHARGFRILLGIVGERNQLYGAGYFQQYAAFVGGVAALGADAIEVWNEMNIDREWPAGSISPASYTELLAASYNAIKAANRNTLVISGAPAPTGFFGGCTGNGCDDNFYVQGLAQAGAANYMDCLGVHYNEGILPPSQTSGDPRGSSAHYSRYFRGMINTYWSAIGGARPLCFTELGYLSPEGFGPLPGGFEWAANTSVAEQASWLDSAVSLSASSGRVRMLIIWNIDFPNYDSDPQAGFAIIRPGGSCPACAALGS